MSDVQQPPNNNPADPTNGPTVRLEPITESFVVPQPWYRRIFGPVMRTETVWKLSVVAILVVGVAIGYKIQSPTVTTTQAAVGKARVSIYPLETRIPPERSFQLWMTSDQPVSTGDITVTFDPKAIQLSREVTSQVIPPVNITFTSWTEANKTGVLEFHIKSKDPATPLEQGTKQFGTFFFNTTKGTTLTTANIMISEEKTTIVNQDAVPFAISTTNASVGLK